jgi:DNA-binding transcriptional MerR regulator
MADHPKDLLTAREVREATGASLRCLQYWDEEKIVSPSKKANGTGTRRLYTREDLVLVTIVKRMRDAKIGFDRIRKHMRIIRRTVRDALEQGRIPQFRPDKKHPLIVIPRGTGVEQVQQIVEALSYGQLVLAIALDPVREELEQKLSEQLSREGARISLLSAG